MLTVKWSGLGELAVNVTKLMKLYDGPAGARVVKAGGIVIREAARANIRAKLNRNPTGRLESETEVHPVNSRRVHIGTLRNIYARVHEYGHPGITPVRAKALRFVVNGQVVFAQKVVIPARPWLRPAATESRDNVEKAMGTAIERTIEQAL
jgi:HK97 gp10 family phage protein